MHVSVSCHSGNSIDCANWAVNFVRFYVEANDETSFVQDLTQSVQEVCQTHNGVPLTQLQRGVVKPDSHLPACQRIQPAATTDSAAFTAYIVFAVVSTGFVLFETYETPDITYKKKS